MKPNDLSINESSEKLRIGYLAMSKRIESGSYRIWVHDYNQYFKDIGVDSEIILISEDNAVEKIGNRDIIIIGKCLHHNLSSIVGYIKSVNSSIVIGTINPPRNASPDGIDFAMVGSMEEFDSLSFYKNVILIPLIESIYHYSEIKKHKKEDILKICYHGWTPHLFSFVCGLKEALERFSKERKIELHIISEKSQNEFNWRHENGLPEGISVLFKKWNINTVKENLQSCDIGICPGVYDMTDVELTVNNKVGKFSTDYVMRYKNKTNNGRALVFMSLGVPVVSDFSPSNFHLFGDSIAGAVAHTPLGWYKALSRFSDHNERNKTSEYAKKFLEKYYNPHVWARRCYEQMLRIWKEKNNSLIIGA